MALDVAAELSEYVLMMQRSPCGCCDLLRGRRKQPSFWSLAPAQFVLPVFTALCGSRRRGLGARRAATGPVLRSTVHRNGRDVFCAFAAVDSVETFTAAGRVCSGGLILLVR